MIILQRLGARYQRQSQLTVQPVAFADRATVPFESGSTIAYHAHRRRHELREISTRPRGCFPVRAEFSDVPAFLK